MTTETCSEALRAAGKAYPRTCHECGLGPCKRHREAPSCNGSQQESQKLTGDAALEPNLPEEPRREDYMLDSLYFADLHKYIDRLRSHAAALGEEIERLKRWYESTISVRELALTDRAERAESALREAREKERERCAKFLDGRISGSPGSLQATLVDAEVIQCAKAIRSMTDEK
jgi:hypothetical protein